MSINGWKYYNHAMIPTGSPDEEVDTSSIENGEIWRNSSGGVPLLARWTSDWDCGFETVWWYTICDKPLNLTETKSNYRYKINKGSKNFDVHEIDPMEHIEELYHVFIAAYNSWPEKYRPQFTHENMITLAQALKNDKQMICYGAFYRPSNELCGFMQVPTYESHVELQVQRVNPEYEKLQINAALVRYLLECNSENLKKKNFYILDGARSINHETHFQDYLEKYFGFRKAYCKLHVAYNPKIKWMIPLLYSMRKSLIKFDGIGIIHQVNAILKMEEIVRNQT